MDRISIEILHICIDKQRHVWITREVEKRTVYAHEIYTVAVGMLCINSIRSDRLCVQIFSF